MVDSYAVGQSFYIVFHAEWTLASKTFANLITIHLDRREIKNQLITSTIIFPDSDTNNHFPDSDCVYPTFFSFLKQLWLPSSSLAFIFELGTFQTMKFWSVSFPKTQSGYGFQFSTVLVGRWRHTMSRDNTALWSILLQQCSKLFSWVPLYFCY
jgi:hypothetical protein